MKKLLSSPEKSKTKGSVFLSSVTLSVALIICCAILFTGVTWAWWTASTAVKTADIVTANYEAQVVVTDQEGNVIEPVEGKYNLDRNVRYTVTITASGTASTGFATFSVDDADFDENGETDVFHTIQIKPGESIFFDIRGYTSLENIEGNWATSSSPDIVLDDPAPVNPVFEGDPRFVKAPIKLVPVDENSSAMIERDGVVETWNTGLGATPYGVNEIKEPDAEGYNATEFDAYYVYGLKVAAKVSELSEYVKVSGDGTYKVYSASGAELAETALVGTGSVIKVYDNATNEVVEEFYIVIFGDIDGDSIISAQDISRTEYEINHRSWSSTESRVGYIFKAANLDLDMMISAQDIAKLSSANNKTASIDQKTGKAS